ncbi:DUF1190 domain-containing protein [Vibrio tapetis]|uniref:DUF1190 domain-containing protein n=1 Tax=Vibrio tapetis subsp. tapetis TaxID=1671868 RepID=A0A2N8Z862_9VIBR|nr:DUF1190 domain-containing protein [Vibrio tapetis]SON48080.1 conserved exported protein of unknown function [Vibrio tapetis subsp. tapetis]
MMKRSQRVILPSMRKDWSKINITPFAVAVSAVVIAGCSDSDPDNDARIYADVEDCSLDNPGYTEQCQAAYENAVNEAMRTAPRYASENDCRVEFPGEECFQPRNSSWFIPAMGGYLFSKMINNSRGYYSEPVYRYGGSWYSTNGRSYGSYNSGYNKVKIKTSEMKKKPAATRTMSRGGFGSTVSAKSSWSKSSSSKSSKSSWGG